MSTLETQKRELSEVSSVRYITNTLLEISAERIKRLRDRFEQNQLFYTEIRDLYALVKGSAERRQELPKDQPKRSRQISVAITSNSRFYGSINAAVIDAFKKHMGESPNRSFMVIGNIGERLLSGTPERKRSVFLNFAADQPTGGEIKHLLKELDSYAEVLFFYPQFINVFLQGVGVLNLSEQVESRGDEQAPVEYLFEPELTQILQFFETRVRHLLLSRAMLESELARTAARLTTMNRADERAQGVLKRLSVSIRKEEQTLDSLRLIESLSGFQKWRKTKKYNV
jgi:F-type H+-transporting ATPase subunit gamma